MTFRLAVSVLAVWILFPDDAAAQIRGAPDITLSGSLGAESDPSVSVEPRGGGGFENIHTVEFAGDRIVEIRLSSGDFDTYLVVETPEGKSYENDDYDGTDSRVSAISGVAGEWRLRVRPFDVTGTGDYQIEIRLGPPGRMIEVVGVLEEGDAESPKGELYDSIPFEAEEGERIRVEAAGDGGLPILVLMSPSGMREYRGFGDSMGKTEVEVTADASGTWHLFVGADVTYGGGFGGYEGMLFISESDPVELQSSETITGALSEDLPQSLRGEFYQSYTRSFEGFGAVRIELESDDFDTYLVIRSPTGKHYVSDDTELPDSGFGSMCEFEVGEDDKDGDWTVTVTSFAEAEVGSYELRISGLSGVSMEGPDCSNPLMEDLFR